MAEKPTLQEAFATLSGVIDSLLSPNGCDWDKEQTPTSLTEYLVEETCELVEAIRFGTTADKREELGDVMFLLFFIARLLENKDGITMPEALSTASEKMIRRHPHVFADTHFDSLADQFRAWDAIKREEKKAQYGDDAPQGVFASLPRAVPPLTKAYRIHAKAARVGFTWPEDQDVEQQVEAEWLEVLDACTRATEVACAGVRGVIGQSGASDMDAKSSTNPPVSDDINAYNGDTAKARIAHELGDHMFSLVELARRKGIKASEALDSANHRFLRRFESMETLARERALVFEDLTLDDKDSLWNEVKEAEKSGA